MRQLLMMATASGMALGVLDTLIRLSPLDGSIHWHAILIAFVIMPAIIIGLTRRLRQGAAPLAAAAALAGGHFLGMLASDFLINGRIWDDLFSVPLMTLPVLIITATLIRLSTRRATAPAQVASTPAMSFEQLRQRARERQALKNR